MSEGEVCLWLPERSEMEIALLPPGGLQVKDLVGVQVPKIQALERSQAGKGGGSGELVFIGLVSFGCGPVI